jgi:hypothetical protein
MMIFAKQKSSLEITLFLINKKKTKH